MLVKILKMLQRPDNGTLLGRGSKTLEIGGVAGFRNHSSAGSLHLLQSVCVCVCALHTLLCIWSSG